MCKKTRKIYLRQFCICMLIFVCCSFLAFNITAYADDAGNTTNSVTTTEVATDDVTSGEKTVSGEVSNTEQQVTENAGSEAAEETYPEIKAKDGKATYDNKDYTNDIPEYVHSVTESTENSEEMVQTEDNSDGDEKQQEKKEEQYYLTENNELVTLSSADKQREEKLSDDMKTVNTSTDDDNKTKTTETTVKSENAIQKAVDKALEDASKNNDAKELVIKVYDGEYAGDIVIDKSRVTSESESSESNEDTKPSEDTKRTDWSNITLKILALGATDGKENDENGESAKVEKAENANILGNIKINCINTIISGFNFLKDAAIEVKDAVLTVYGTDKDDKIIITGEQTSNSDEKNEDSKQTKTQINVYALGGDDIVIIKGSVPEAKEEQKESTSSKTRELVNVNTDSSCKIDLGSGSDIVKVDASAACFTKKVQIDGASGTDILFVTGKITADKSSVNTTTRDITLAADSTDLKDDEKEKVETVVISSAIENGIYTVENYLDEIDNKTQKKIDQTTKGDLWSYIDDSDKTKGIVINKASDFEDYVIDITDSAVKELVYGQSGLYTVKFKEGIKGFLTNLVIKGDDVTVNSIGYIDTSDIQKIDIDCLNLKVTCKNITLNDKIIVNNLQALSNAIDEQASVLDIDEIDALKEIRLSDASVTTSILLTDTSDIMTSGTIWLEAESDLSHALLNYDKDSTVAVKSGEAVIIVNGKASSLSNIFAKSKVNITIDSSNKSLSKYYIPFAVNIAITDSKVETGSNSSILANGKVLLEADSVVKLKTTAVTGKLPITAAVSVVDSKASTDINGKITADDIDIKSVSKIDIVNKAESKLTIKEKEKQEEDKKNKLSSSEETEYEKIYGGYIAVTVVTDECKANISGILNGTSSIDVEALPEINVTTVATSESAPKENAKAKTGTAKTEEETTNYLSNLFEKISDYYNKSKEDSNAANDSNPTIKPFVPSEKAKKAIDDAKSKTKKADKKIDDAAKKTEEKGSSTTPTPITKSQYIGAVAVSVVDEETLADISSDIISKKLNVTAKSDLKVSTKADASQVKESKEKEKLASSELSSETSSDKYSLGVGVVVDIINMTTTARTTSGNFDSDVAILSDAKLKSDTEAKAGYNLGDFGLAGTIAVGVKDIRTYAYNDAASIAEGKAIEIKALTDADISIAANSACPKTETTSGEKIGVGGAVAVEVSNVETVARLYNNNEESSAKYSDVNILAQSKLKEKTSSIAGSVGGTSLTPSLSVMASGAYVEAVLGKENKTVNTDGKVTVKAVNKTERSISADASSAGESAAIGGAFSVDVLTDETLSCVECNVNASSLSVEGGSTHSLKSSAKASAQGAKQKDEKKNSDEENPSVDDHIDQIMDNIVVLANSFEEETTNGKTKTKGSGLKPDKAKGATDKTQRTKAETYEGKIGVAAAVCVNISSSECEASIPASDIKTTGDVTIAASNAVTYAISADGSTTKTTGEGIGVAVAINVPTIKTLAYFGTGSIEAKSLYITAGQDGVETSKLTQYLRNENSENGSSGNLNLDGYNLGFNLTKNNINTEAISGAGAGKVGVAGAVAIAVIDSSNDAYMATPASGKKAKFENDLTSGSGNVYLRADANQQIKTVASAQTNTYTNPNTQKTTKVADANKNAVEKANENTEDKPKSKDSNSDAASGNSEESDEGNDSYNVDKEKTAEEKAKEEENRSNTGIGASFALSIVSNKATAYIYSSRNLEGANYHVYIFADSLSYVGTGAVAGKENKDVQKANTAVDAAVAITIVDNVLKTGAGTNGTDTGTVDFSTPLSVDIRSEMRSHESKTQASAYACGGPSKSTDGTSITDGGTAVGATVALAVVNGDITADFYAGKVTAMTARNVWIETYETTLDTVDSVASAVGAKSDSKDKKKDKEKKTNDSNSISDIIDEKIGCNSDALAFSVAVLSLKDAEGQPYAKKESTYDEEIEDAIKTANTEGGCENTVPSATSNGAKGIDVAASVGIAITDNNSLVTIRGTIHTDDFKAKAYNNSVFRARATGAATGKDNTNDVAMSVAVAVDNNDTIVDFSGNINPLFQIVSGPVLFEATSITNMNTTYNAAQAISGSFSGKSSDVTVAGAVAIVINNGNTKVHIHNGESNFRNEILGESITAKATDTTKLAVRAGAVTKSGATTTVGAGASYALVYDNSSIDVIIGDYNEETKSYVADNLKITSQNIDIKAVKQRVELSDSTLINVIKALVDIKGQDVIDGASQGSLINVVINQETGKVEFKFGTNNIYETIISTLGYFVEQSNYYAEAIGGTISGKDSTVSEEGSCAMVLYSAKVRAIIGDNIIIGNSGSNESNGISIAAENKSRARVIAGSLSISKPNVGVGASVGIMKDNSETLTSIGKNSKITSNGFFNQSSEASNEYLVVCIAPSVTSGGTTTANIGAAVDVVILNDSAIATIGENTEITAKKDIDITAKRFDRALVTAGDAVIGSSKVAAGGSVSVIVDKGTALSDIGKECNLTSSNGNISIESDSSEKLLNVNASVSCAKANTNAAASIGVLVSKSNTKALIGEYSTIAAKAVILKANSSSYLLPISGVVSSGKGDSGRGSVIVNVFNRNVISNIGKYSTIKATDGSVEIDAFAYDWNMNIVGVLGATTGTSFSACVPVIISKNTVKATIDEGVKINTSDSIGAVADIDSFSFTVGGDVNLSLKSESAYGASVSVIDRSDIVYATVANNTLLTAEGNGEGIKIPGKDETIKKGIVISSKIRDKGFVVSATASAGTGSNGRAASSTVIIRNESRACLGGSSDDDYHSSGKDISVLSDNDTKLIVITASAAVSSKTNALGSVGVVIFNKNSLSEIKGKVDSTGEITVSAKAKDELYVISGAVAAGSRAIDGEVTVVVFKDTVKAILNGNVKNSSTINICAVSDTKLYAIGGSIAVGTGNASGTGSVVVTYFEGNTYAYTGDNLKINTGDLTICANSKEYISCDSLGASVSSSIDISGSIDVLVSEINTCAFIGENNTITANDITVKANDEYELFAISASLAAGSSGITVNALVVVDFDNVSAKINKDGDITCNNLSVISSSSTNAFTTVGSVGAGSSAGVPVAVTVIVKGSKIGKDAYDELTVYDKDSNTRKLDLDVFANDAFSYCHNRAISFKPTLKLSDAIQSDEQSIPTEFERESSSTNTEAKKSIGEIIAEESKSGDARDITKDEVTDYDNLYDSVKNVKIEEKALSSDATSAVICSGTIITRTGVVTVKATDSIAMESISGTIGVSGSAGVGFGVSVLYTASDVLAEVQNNVTIKGNEDIIVEASSGALDTDNKAQHITRKDSKVATHQAVLDTINKLNIVDQNDISKRSENKIMLIGASLSVGGSAAVGINGGIAIIFNDVDAVFDGIAENPEDITVSAISNYDEILNISASLGLGGTAGVVDVAFTYYELDEDNYIGDNAVINDATGNIILTSKGTMEGRNYSGDLAVAGYTLAAGVSIYINRSDVDTFISPDAKIEIGSGNKANVELYADYKTDSAMYNISAGVGAVAVGPNVTVGYNTIKVKTYLGISKNANDELTNNAINITGAENIIIINKIDGDMALRAVGVSGGAVSVAPVVTVGISDMKSEATLLRCRVNTDNIMVKAFYEADIVNTPYMITAGAVSVGPSAVISKQISDNIAEVTLDKNSVIRGNVTVAAGDNNTDDDTNYNHADVISTSIVGGAGAVNVLVDVVLSLNDFDNYAIFTADDAMIKGDVDVHAYAVASAYTIGAVYSAGAIDVKSINVISKLDADQKAEVSSSSKLTIEGNLTVASHLNDITDFKETTWTIILPNKEVVQRNKNKSCEAHILAYSVGAGEVNVHTAIAYNDTDSNAFIDCKSINVLKKLKIDACGNVESIATVEPFNASALCVGVVVTYAYADGEVNARLIIRDAIQAGEIDIVNKTKAYALSEMTPAVKALKLDALRVAVNVCSAKVITISNASIENGSSNVNNGIVSANDDITVKNISDVEARSIANPTAVNISGAEVTVNVLSARLDDTQKAFIKCEKVSSDFGNICVNAIHNLNFDETTASENAGAYAMLGASGASKGLELSFTKICPNVGKAKSESLVEAYIYVKSIKAKGNINVNTKTASKVDASSLLATVNIDAAKIAVNDLKATIDDTIRAYIALDGGQINAENLFITVNHTDTADSCIGPVGGYVDISGFDIQVNRAESTINSENKNVIESKLIGNGTVNLSGNLNVTTSGNAEANSKFKDTSAVTVSFINVKPMTSKSQNNIKQEAFIESVDGTLTINAHQLKVSSDMVSKSDAVVGCEKGVTVAAIDGTGFIATSISGVVNNAYIKNVDATLKSNLEVSSKNNNTVTSESKKPIDVSAIKVARTNANSTASNENNAYISGGNISVKGIADVKSEMITDSTAKGVAGHSIDIIGVGSTSVVSQVGTKDKQNISKAGIKDGASLTATGDVNIKSINTGTNKAESIEGFKLDAISTDFAIVPTYSYYLTEIDISGKVHSDSSISAVAKDESSAVAQVNGNTVGVVVSANNKCAENHVFLNTAINVGENSDISANNDVNIKNDTKSIVKTDTYFSNGGFVTDGTAKGITEFNRNVKLEVAKNAKIRGENVNLLTVTNGTNGSDEIDSDVFCGESGGVSVDKANSEIIYSSVSAINIKNGAEIEATKDVVINADINTGKVSSRAIATGSSVAGGSTAISTIEPKGDKHTIESTIEIGEDDSDKVKIIGRKVGISASQSGLDCDSIAYSYLGAAKGSSDARASEKMDMLIKVDLKNANITGVDSVKVESNATPKETKDIHNLFSESLPDLEAAVGSKTSYASLYKGNTAVECNVGKDVTIKSDNTYIGSDFKIETLCGAYEESHTIYSEDHIKETNEFYEKDSDKKWTIPLVKANSNIQDGTRFIIGETESYEIVEVNNKDNTAEVVSTDSRFGCGYSVDNINKTVTFDNMGINPNGELTVKGNKNPNGLKNCTVETINNIERIIFNNNSDYNLVFNDVSTRTLGKPVIAFTDCVSEELPQIKSTPEDNGYEMTITMNKGGNIYFNGVVSNEGGDLTVNWNGDKCGGNITTNNTIVKDEKNVNALNVHNLTINGANKVGATEINPLKITMTKNEDIQNPQVNIKATGNVNLSVNCGENTDGIDIGSIYGSNIFISSDGAIFAATPNEEYNIKANSLKIKTSGDIGKETAYVHVYIPGILAAHSETDEIYIINHYVAPPYDPGKKDEDKKEEVDPDPDPDKTDSENKETVPEKPDKIDSEKEKDKPDDGILSASGHGKSSGILTLWWLWLLLLLILLYIYKKYRDKKKEQREY